MLRSGWIRLEVESNPPDLHGSSVGEASARHISHCPQASKDAVWRVTRDSRVKGFSNVAEVFGSLTARGAEAWTSGGIRQQSFCDSWPFLPLGGNGLFVSLLSFDSSPERYMEPNDDKPPSPAGTPEDTLWEFQR
jgi:hypothetical protein